MVLISRLESRKIIDCVQFRYIVHNRCMYLTCDFCITNSLKRLKEIVANPLYHIYEDWALRKPKRDDHIKRSLVITTNDKIFNTI